MLRFQAMLVFLPSITQHTPCVTPLFWSPSLMVSTLVSPRNVLRGFFFVPGLDHIPPPPGLSLCCPSLLKPSHPKYRFLFCLMQPWTLSPSTPILRITVWQSINHAWAGGTSCTALGWDWSPACSSPFLTSCVLSSSSLRGRACLGRSFHSSCLPCLSGRPVRVLECTGAA